MPSIDRNSPAPFYQQVYEQIAHGIETGLHPAGKKLPSIRECARELGVSNTTIELAYQRLTEEGYVQARRGSGYTICEMATKPVNPSDEYDAAYKEALEALAASEQKRSAQQGPEFDFSYDSVDTSTFPFTAWARICREVYFNPGAEAACLYNDRQGLYDLRVEIARYLGGEYGANCVAEQVLVMPTTRDLMSAILSCFDPNTTTIAMEDPGYDEVGKSLISRGFAVQRIPVHPYPIWPDAMKFVEGAQLVFTTPACQFPTNNSMPIELRQGLVDWAKETGAYLIDDEYGWEFQTGIARMPSLATLDRSGRVISIGTFSNSFTPAVCLSYAVLPPKLMMMWQEKHRDTHPQVPWQTQAAMTAFMKNDLWRTHVRRVRTSLQSKRQLLLDAIEHHMGDSVEVVEGLSSLFVLVQTEDGRPGAELVKLGEQVGVRVYSTSRYWTSDIPSDWRYVLIGFGGIPAKSIDEGIETLARAWGLQD